MSQTTASAVITARVKPHHVEQLRQIADHNASTVSRVVGRILEVHLDAGPVLPVPQRPARHPS
jgi:hypothetical protein